LNLSYELLLAVATVIANAAITWGIVRTQLEWLRRDVDDLRERVLPIRKGT
jgi:hypothetical protein